MAWVDVGAGVSVIGVIKGVGFGEIRFDPHPVKRRVSKVNAAIVYRICFSLPSKSEPEYNRPCLRKNSSIFFLDNIHNDGFYSSFV